MKIIMIIINYYKNNQIPKAIYRLFEAVYNKKHTVY